MNSLMLLLVLLALARLTGTSFLGHTLPFSSSTEPRLRQHPTPLSSNRTSKADCVPLKATFDEIPRELLTLDSSHVRAGKDFRRFSSQGKPDPPSKENMFSPCFENNASSIFEQPDHPTPAC
ncbi:hypothetical protein BDZ45DRAFT_669380 [Acephala macrosclerotiorum]|nr:hypothetical protein BDZ45DRAFT_669380 [Acephala macrosclerotiorum]